MLTCQSNDLCFRLHDNEGSTADSVTGRMV